ncbi:arginine/serine-rich protein 1 isoform X1 [Acanthopagrus latus]|uniref:arginine/serine-rich protein 1 isoform X1 n=1 Tax=Acanthopagrus latus TaxID=8177 RepID=UPI00187C6AEC|nr:arginine/serine-rich protein 1 isoform X1 [Acanthopagrus latus]
MAKVKDSHSEMAKARQSDGINVIFDKESSSSSRSHSRSRSPGVNSRSSGSSRHRGRGSYRRRYRSSSSSCSRSSSRSRSRSHPRCHRRSSRCRCDNHPRYGRGRYRAHSRSLSRSASPDRYSRRRQYRSRSRSSSRQTRHRRDVSRLRYRSSRSSSRANRSRSKSRASTHSVSLSLDDKMEFLNAVKIQGAEKLGLLESVKPILSEQSVESRQRSPDTWVRHDPDERTPSKSDEVEPDDMPSPTMSPTRKIISFSINNSVAKPTVAAPSSAKVTPRVDIYESRKPYGHWVPVRTGQNSRKRTLTIL